MSSAARLAKQAVSSRDVFGLSITGSTILQHKWRWEKLLSSTEQARVATPTR